MSHDGAESNARRRIINISGTIGAGKTTLVDCLARDYGYNVAPERVDARLLKLFYDDPKRWAFIFQLDTVAGRCHIYHSVVQSARDTLMDRSMFDDRIFADVNFALGNIGVEDYARYCTTYDDLVARAIPGPDLFVYLDVDPAIARSRITSRGRECESSITVSYLEKLRDAHEDWIKTLPPARVLRLDWNHPPPPADAARFVAGEIDRLLGVRVPDAS